MVKMRYLCIASVCIHGLLAFSIRQYSRGLTQQAHQHFSVTLLTSPKGTDEKIPSPIEHVSVSKSKTFSPELDPKSSKIISRENVNTTKSSSNINPSTTETTAITPSVMYNPAPKYPVNAKANGQEAEFTVKLRVNIAGNIEHIEVISIKGNKELFEQELLKTIKTWKFSPCGKEVSFEIPISFQLD